MCTLMHERPRDETPLLTAKTVCSANRTRNGLSSVSADAPEDQILDLLWLEAVALIEDSHPALVERKYGEPDTALVRTAFLKRLGEDLQSYAAAAEAIIRRRGERR